MGEIPLQSIGYFYSKEAEEISSWISSCIAAIYPVVYLDRCIMCLWEYYCHVVLLMTPKIDRKKTDNVRHQHKVGNV